MQRFLMPLLIGLVGAGILISLGVWQVQRLAWKNAILSDIEARIAQAPAQLPDSPDPERDTYLPVVLTGQFGSEELHVLVSQKRIGAGFRVIAPFETDTGRRVMVDRGFIRDEAKASERAKGQASVTGNLHWPQEIDSYTPAPDLKAEVWFARDVPAMADALGTEPVLLVAAEVSPETAGVTPLPVDTAGIPNNHLQYAITWFALAFVWLSMTGYWMWRLRRND